jgi:hypothetical protein
MNMDYWLNDNTEIIDNLFDNDNLSLEFEESKLDTFDDINFKKLSKIKYNKYEHAIIGEVEEKDNVVIFQIQINKSTNLNNFLNCSMTIFAANRISYTSIIKIHSLFAEKNVKFKNNRK